VTAAPIKTAEAEGQDIRKPFFLRLSLVDYERMFQALVTKVDSFLNFGVTHAVIAQLEIVILNYNNDDVCLFSKGVLWHAFNFEI